MKIWLFIMVYCLRVVFYLKLGSPSVSEPVLGWCFILILALLLFLNLKIKLCCVAVSSLLYLERQWVVAHFFNPCFACILGWHLFYILMQQFCSFQLYIRIGLQKLAIDVLKLTVRDWCTNLNVFHKVQLLWWVLFFNP